MARLKVFRTPIGFHDAYVAASSRKAALTAWGSDKDLFARGAAEEVTDPALTGEPLATPGKVIRKLRGTLAEQLAAGDAAKAGRKAPKPSRAALDQAEAAVAAAAHAAQERALTEEARRIAKALEALRRTQATELAKRAEARDRAAAAYERALEKWRG